MERKLLVLAAVLALATGSQAQVNAKGAVQVGLGLDLGVHATNLNRQISVLGFTIKDSKEDHAATVTVPVEVQYGLSDRFSLGGYLEPGRYLDSAGTNPNKLLLLGASLRYYALNSEPFALYLHADLGVVGLRLSEVQNGRKKHTDQYGGGHIRLGVAGQYFFGPIVGIHAGARVIATDLNWKERDPKDPLLDAANYKANLKTLGLQFEVGVQVRLRTGRTDRDTAR